MISDNDEFEEIPRSRLLTAPKIIMYKLVFNHLGEMSGKTLKKILKRSHSQVAQNVSKLVNKGLIIKVNKNRRESLIRATKLGTSHIQEYYNNSFKDVMNYLNFINKLEEIDENMHRKIELVYSVLKNQDFFQKALENLKTEERRKSLEHSRQVYDRVESGNVAGTLIEKVFDFRNKNPNIKLLEVKVEFEDHKPQAVKTYYHLWYKITLEKYKKKI